MEIRIIGVKLVKSRKSRRTANVLNEQAEGTGRWIRVCHLFMGEDHLERSRVPVGREGDLESEDKCSFCITPLSSV